MLLMAWWPLTPTLPSHNVSLSSTKRDPRGREGAQLAGNAPGKRGLQVEHAHASDPPASMSDRLASSSLARWNAPEPALGRADGLHLQLRPHRRAPIVFDFQSDGPVLGNGETGVLSVDGKEVTRNSMQNTTRSPSRKTGGTRALARPSWSIATTFRSSFTGTIAMLGYGALPSRPAGTKQKVVLGSRGPLPFKPTAARRDV